MTTRPPALRLALTLFAAALSAVTAFATHNRAGEIRVEQIGTGLRVRATITTYTAVLGASQEADRDSLLIDWGDGSTTWVFRGNGPTGPGGVGQGVSIGNNLQRNVYAAEHAYSGRGSYTISMEDPNRIAGILNIDQSINEVFYLETVFTFLNTQFQGPNSTPQLLQEPIDDGCVGKRFVHNPNAFDPDGDSLSYELGVPRSIMGQPIPNYRFPSEFTSDAGASEFELDPVTGTLTWEFPRREGSYNAVILIISWRGGRPIDTTLRDMQIFIAECDNEPPVVEVANDFCLVAGDTLTLDPVATAPIDEDQEVSLTVSAAALDFAVQPATWTGGETVDDFEDQPYTARFDWETACEHVERYPYNVIFKATDDGGSAAGNATRLSTLEVVEVLVSAPPPEALDVVAGDGLIDLTWDSPYACEAAQDSFFYGFAVYRREGSNPFPYDSCRQGLDGEGYTLIEDRTLAQRDGRYVFTDDDIERGRTYCYRIVGRFVRYTAAGNPFNLIESIASEEVCVQSSRDLPLLTRVDVLETSPSAGRIDVRWTAPLAEDLDTAANPPPYVYEVLRSPGIGTSDFAAVPGTRRSFSTFAALERDTMFVDEGLDTENVGYTYAVAFTSAGQEGLPPLPSSSHFLGTAGSDGAITLTWAAETSWENVSYAVLLETELGGFDTLARVTETRYVDAGLENGVERCYRIVAFGTYGVGEIYSPLINRSQVACGVALDTMPPCPPTVSVRSVCDDIIEEASTEPPYTNTISWSFDDCPPADDLTAVRVYELSDSVGSSRALIAEVDATAGSSLRDERPLEVAACYAVTAVDSTGNESPLSASFCVGNCPFYDLPNVFTPNDDGQNDVLRPRVSRFVETVNLQIFNRWGVLVYETTDPQLGWDGTARGGGEVSEGTFFYTCEVFERLPEGGVGLVGTEPLSGYIEVLRGG